jgi:hypothetical protein
MWSHDQFTTDASGYNSPVPGSNYCDQAKAWELMGNRMLDKAWQGLNVTMFAYGQTGSGKSYTMFGYGANRGVVPMAADRIFERIRANTDPNIEFKVTVHMVEIYMEKINDLLIDKKARGEPLKIRENKGDIYVEGVQQKAVDNYD